MEDALKAARRLHAVIAASFEIEGIDLDVEASIGVVISGLHGDDSSSLLQRADIAMYEAKTQGKGILAYDPGSDQRSPERLAMLGDLRRGLDRDVLYLDYQPQVSLSTGKVMGVEALVRSRHPTGVTCKTNRRKRELP
nr:diguanylate cyclase [Pseudomonas sp. dw_612]